MGLEGILRGEVAVFLLVRVVEWGDGIGRGSAWVGFETSHRLLLTRESIYKRGVSQDEEVSRIVQGRDILAIPTRYGTMQYSVTSAAHSIMGTVG